MNCIYFLLLLKANLLICLTECSLCILRSWNRTLDTIKTFLQDAGKTSALFVRYYSQSSRNAKLYTFSAIFKTGLEKKKQNSSNRIHSTDLCCLALIIGCLQFRFWTKRASTVCTYQVDCSWNDNSVSDFFFVVNYFGVINGVFG